MIRLQIVTSLIILAILALFLGSSSLLMPNSVHTMLMLGLMLGFLAFVGLIWRERAQDEREALHMQLSGRISFFVGTALLVIGILWQATTHNIDPWLIYALASMVLAKVISRIFHHFKN